MKRTAKQVLLEAAQAALQGGIGTKLNSTDIANAIVGGQQIAGDAEYFVRKAVGALSGTQDILDTSIVRTKGVTNFTNAKLPTGRALVVTHISVASMVNASVTGDEYSNVIADPNVANGEIQISQDDKVLLDMPVNAFTSLAGGERIVDKYLELENPILIQPDVPVAVKIYFPAATVANTNVEVKLKGAENRQR